MGWEGRMEDVVGREDGGCGGKRYVFYRYHFGHTIQVRPYEAI